MHSTSTRFAGLPILFNLVASLRLDEIIEKVVGTKREYSFVQLILLIVSLRIAGITRLYHVNQIEDIFLRDSLGFKKLPDQSTLNRLLGRIDPVKGRLLFRDAARAMVKDNHINGVILAADAHFIQYYGKKQPLARKGYCPARRTSVRGFKLHVIYDVASGIVLSYRITPGDVDSRKLVPRLLRDAFEVVNQKYVRYLLVDRGFYDRKLFTRLGGEKIFFVIPVCHQVRSKLKKMLSLDIKQRLLSGQLIDIPYLPKQKLSFSLRLIVEPALETNMSILNTLPTT